MRLSRISRNSLNTIHNEKNFIPIVNWWSNSGVSWNLKLIALQPIIGKLKRIKAVIRYLPSVCMCFPKHITRHLINSWKCWIAFLALIKISNWISFQWLKCPSEWFNCSSGVTSLITCPQHISIELLCGSWTS